ncbi:MAG: UDP-glucose/GDP-mannose dehydrogenase family protein [Thaumarchaeota archaeon]|nr:UDP-glucose/GDP-mannose dehydrogenase family protein [Nitrososphaerota archaeon]
MKKVSVVGLGYVGLTFSACLASKGFKVYGVEVDEEKRKLISEGRSPIYEEGLDDLLREAVLSGFLKVTRSFHEAITNSEITFICVGTPSSQDGSVDLTQVESASREVGEALRNKSSYHLVVVRSTVPPGTTEGLVKGLLESGSGKRCGLEIGLCFSPEFLREGKAVEDTLNPDRIVIGAIDERSGKYLMEFYRSFYSDKLPQMIITNLVNAELIKYANNAFLAMKISFANMIARLCEKLPGADVNMVMDGIGLDKRIGRAFLGAGLGWGGSCFPKDTRGLISFAEKLGVDLKLVKASVEVNEEQVDHAVSIAERMLSGLKGKTISILGLAFKPGTDDVRESRAIKLVKKLLEKGARVKAHDPKAIENARKILGDAVEYARSIEECLRSSDLCILATEWPEYKMLRMEALLRLMRNPALLDCRRIYDPKDFQGIKFAAIGFGKSP